MPATRCDEMRPRRAVPMGALLVVLTACADGTAAPPDARPTPSSAAPSPAAPSPSPVTPARRARTVLAPEAPRLVALPSGRVVAVEPAGTRRSGLLDVPDDVGVAGWWEGGSRLGDPFGSILLAAHVDSRTQGLGPFAELLTVARGARVSVRSAGLTQEFVVRSRRLVAQGGLADDAWIHEVSGASRLTLVTCAPPYDASRGGYQYLAVVTAVPIGPPEAS